jgi:hypothetical protein
VKLIVSTQIPKQVDGPHTMGHHHDFLLSVILSGLFETCARRAAAVREESPTEGR